MTDSDFRHGGQRAGGTVKRLDIDRAFLTALFGDLVTGGLTINVRGVRHEGRDRARQLFAASIEDVLTGENLKTLTTWHLDGGRSIYVGVALRRNRDGKKAGCAATPALWTDLDAKDDANTNTLLTRIETRLPESLQPSILVDSGRGLHAWWLLDAPVIIPEDRVKGAAVIHAVEARLRGLQQYLDADPARTDISSVMRLPGTYNLKYEDRPLCQVIELDATRRFPLSAFDEYLPRPKTERARKNTSGWMERALQGVDGPETRAPGAPGRNETGTKLAGYFFRRGDTSEQVLAEVREWNLKNRPPLSNAEVERLVESIDRARFNGGPPPPPLQAPLELPDSAFMGLARDFADLYSAHLESPRVFFYIAFLTYFGAAIAGKVTLGSELSPEPRLYTVLLGTSSDSRKSTAIGKTHAFFEALPADLRVPTLFGVGSAEGIAAELGQRGNLLLHFDELKAFVDKAKIQHSVALPMVNTLFEGAIYDNRTRETKISVRGARLSLLAACTTDTYSSMFDHRFLDIGFVNRLFVVTGSGVRKASIPTPVPEEAVADLRRRTEDRLRQIDAACRAHGDRPVAYPMTPGANQLFDRWYFTSEESVFRKRLDTYGLRFLVLLTAVSGAEVIDEPIARAVVALLDYELETRREVDPVDADNLIAKLEQGIRRQLTRGRMGARDLKRAIHADRAGTWFFETAVANLRRAGELAHDPASAGYWLEPAKNDSTVTNSVTTPK